MLAIGTASKEEFQKQVEESARSEMQVVSKAQTIVWLTQSCAGGEKGFEAGARGI
jgi:hypothetical protein